MMKSLFNQILMLSPSILNFLMLMILSIPFKTINFHPLIMMIMLIFLTFIISLKINLFFYSWMNFILILILIGGLMIIFLYITSLTNNELLMINLKPLKIKMFFLLILFIFIYNLFPYNFNSQNYWPSTFFNFEEKNEMSLSNLFYSLIKPLIFLMIYLYYSMICIMNICYLTNSPLRQIYFYE